MGYLAFSNKALARGQKDWAGYAERNEAGRRLWSIALYCSLEASYQTPISAPLSHKARRAATEFDRLGAIFNYMNQIYEGRGYCPVWITLSMSELARGLRECIKEYFGQEILDIINP